MGEIADMMLEGVMCQVCGEWLGGDGDGYPVTCDACLTDTADQIGELIVKRLKTEVSNNGETDSGKKRGR